MIPKTKSKTITLSIEIELNLDVDQVKAWFINRAKDEDWTVDADEIRWFLEDVDSSYTLHQFLEHGGDVSDYAVSTEEYLEYCFNCLS